jgi:hypothetical protein
MEDAPQPLDDGEYDVLIIDCEKFPDGTVRTGVVVVSGPSKGAVATVIGPIPKRAGEARGAVDEASEAFDETALMGLPARLRVSAGRPHLEIDD